MKKMLALALTSLLCMHGAAALPAQAADTEKDVYVKSVCPDFVPLSDDTITFSGLPSGNAQIRIEQHSPERSSLLLYDAEVECVPERSFVFQVEPGEYTVSISASNIAGGASMTLCQHKIVIKNADYSIKESDVPYERSNITYTASYSSTNDDISPKATLKSNETAISGSVKEESYAISFPFYQRTRGDFDGNGEIDSADAQLTLNAYTESLAGFASKVQPAATAACDINGDNMLSADDAQHILNYYTEALANNTPHWFDEQ